MAKFKVFLMSRNEVRGSGMQAAHVTIVPREMTIIDAPDSQAALDWARTEYSHWASHMAVQAVCSQSPAGTDRVLP